MAPADPAESADKTYVLIPLEVRIQGTWADTVDYLKSINKLNRGLRAVELHSPLSRPAGTGDPVLPNYSESTTILLQSYMIPASTGTGADRGSCACDPIVEDG